MPSATSSTSQFRYLLSSIPEAQLDANRSVLIRGERVFVPRKIPKLSRSEKRKMLAEQFEREGGEVAKEFWEETADWERKKQRGRRKGGKERKRNRRNKGRQAATSVVGGGGGLRPWRVQYIVRRQHNAQKINANIRTRNTERCPDKLDAVTEAFNKRLYVFAGELVHELWRDRHNLQQRQAFALSDLFPGGPRRVTAAFTNQKSGVTVLLDHRNVYRFRWDKRNKRFLLTPRKGVHQLPVKVGFLPRMGLQWNGQLILLNNEKFASYDPYWNFVPFSSDKANEYFPNLERKVIGVAKHGREAHLLVTDDGKMQVYDMGKHNVLMEFPLNLRRMLACLSNSTS